MLVLEPVEVVADALDPVAVALVSTDTPLAPVQAQRDGMPRTVALGTDVSLLGQSIDISAETNLTGGTGILLTGDDLTFAPTPLIFAPQAFQPRLYVFFGSSDKTGA